MTESMPRNLSGKDISARVRLYTKPACPLCDEARDLLEALGDEFVFTTEEVDITADPALFAMFRTIIPVVEVPGVGRVDAPLDRRRLRRLFIEARLPRRRRWRLPWRLSAR